MNKIHSWSDMVASARSFLFIPANRPERFSKALASNADALVLDLEDSVPEEQKELGRQAITEAWTTTLKASPKPVVVRINPPVCPAGEEDLRWLSSLQPPPVIMVAKADDAKTLKAVGLAAADSPLLPLIESAQSYVNLSEIAAEPQVVRLVLGHIDFMVDTGIQCSDDQHELDALRFAVSIQSRRFQLAAPVDGVTVDVNDKALLRSDMQRALRFGFGAKLCIHPRQVDGIHEALSPSEREIEWAQRVLEGNLASKGAAFKLDGRMVDVPIVLQAQRTLARIR